MLKEFWEAKKHIIQMVGIFIAIGALFLSIPLPEDPHAQNALRDMQFLWVIVVSFSVLVLLGNLWKLILNFEKHAKEVYRIDFDSTLGATFTGATLYFLVNLWIYISTIYKNSFSDLINFAGYGIGGVMVILGFEMWQWTVRKVKSPQWLVMSISIGTLLLVCLGVSSFFTYILQRDRFSVRMWLLISFVMFLTTFGSAALREWRKSSSAGVPQ